MIKCYKLDKFERWLNRYYPEHIDKYKRGYNEGEIEIEEIKFNKAHKFYNIYLNDKILGTLVD